MSAEKKIWIPFLEAREYARSLKLRSYEEWRKRVVKTKNFPSNIPKDPRNAYSEWISGGDWVGTGRIADQYKKEILFYSYDEAKIFIQNINIKSALQYQSYHRINKLNFLPIRPECLDGWISWNDFLNNDNIYYSTLTLNQRRNHFIERSNKKFEKKFIFPYLKEEFIDVISKITIICSEGHEFVTTPMSHLQCSGGCTECKNEKTKIRFSKSKSGKYLSNNFISKEFDKNKNSISIHEISLNSGKKVWWICSNCKNSYEARVSDRIGHNSGCPKCKSSKGEKEIINTLNKNNIIFKHQYLFKDLIIGKGRYKCDFYLPQYNMIIEFDGQQHFNYNNRGWNTKKNHIETLRRDQIKNQFCKDNKIKLIRIPYTKQDQIEEILTREYLKGFPRSINYSQKLLN